MSDYNELNTMSGRIDKEYYHGKYGKCKLKFETKKELNELIIDIMCTDGPDGHCDGSQIIAEVIWKRFIEISKHNFGKENECGDIK